MSTITYKCPNCDADLTYRPATGDFGCEYCGSSYTVEQLNELIKNQKIIDEQKESEAPPLTSTRWYIPAPTAARR